jgi:hypothetical protein
MFYGYVPIYDPRPKTEDVTESVAVHTCENCGKACDELIDLPTWQFKACPECAEEAARQDAREAAELRKAAAQAKPCVHCKTRISRWDSIYCSEACKSAFLASFNSEVA